MEATSSRRVATRRPVRSPDPTEPMYVKGPPHPPMFFQPNGGGKMSYGCDGTTRTKVAFNPNAGDDDTGVVSPTRHVVRHPDKSSAKSSVTPEARSPEKPPGLFFHSEEDEMFGHGDETCVGATLTKIMCDKTVVNPRYKCHLKKIDVPEKANVLESKVPKKSKIHEAHVNTICYLAIDGRVDHTPNATEPNADEPNADEPCIVRPYYLLAEISLAKMRTGVQTAGSYKRRDEHDYNEYIADILSRMSKVPGSSRVLPDGARDTLNTLGISLPDPEACRRLRMLRQRP